MKHIQKDFNLSQLKYGSLAIFYVKFNRFRNKNSKPLKVSQMGGMMAQLHLVSLLNLIKLIDFEVDSVKGVDRLSSPISKTSAVDQTFISNPSQRRVIVQMGQKTMILTGKTEEPLMTSKEKEQAFLELVGEKGSKNYTKRKKKWKQVGLEKFIEEDNRREKLLREQWKNLKARVVLELDGKKLTKEIDPASLTLAVLEEFRDFYNQNNQDTK